MQKDQNKLVWIDYDENKMGISHVKVSHIDKTMIR